MKRLLILLPVMILLTSCAVRYTGEDTGANAPVSVEDNRDKTTLSQTAEPSTSITEAITALIEKTAKYLIEQVEK